MIGVTGAAAVLAAVALAIALAAVLFSLFEFALMLVIPGESLLRCRPAASKFDDGLPDFAGTFGPLKGWEGRSLTL